MPYPYDYTYFRPSKGEQLALMGGSIGSALLGAMSGQTKGDAIKNAIAGAVAGYGGGYKNYQDMMGDAWKRNLADKQFGQDVKSYEEIDKPYKQAIINEMGRKLDNKVWPEDIMKYEYGQQIQNPQQKADYYDRIMPLRTSKSPVNTGKVKSYEDYLADVSKIDEKIADLKSKNLTGDYNNAIDSLTHRRNMLMNKAEPPSIPTAQKSTENTPQGQNDLTEENLNYTANLYGISKEEVLKRLGIK